MDTLRYNDHYSNIYNLNLKLRSTFYTINYLFNSLLNIKKTLLLRYYKNRLIDHIFNNKYSYLKLSSILFIFYTLKKIKNHYALNSISSLLLHIPYINKKINSKLKESALIIESSFNNSYNNYNKLPFKSVNEVSLREKINSMIPTKKINNDKISGTIYINDKIHNDKLIEIFKQFSYSNPLHGDIYPQITCMEIDIINICKNLYKGNDFCCGNVTYGGTESLLLCCLTYRDYYYDRNITNPNIVAPETIHPAVDKACHYFNIKLIKVPLYKNTGTININNLESYINSNTILLIGSAPCYSYGTIDPLKSMGEIASFHNIGFHIDCCMGGFLLPFIEKFKYISFELPGVTSISMDIHKYGYSFKGSSVILYNSFKLKKYQHTINSKWNGGIYATPTIMGTKSGGLIACAWASLLYIGLDNFTKYANEIVNLTNYITEYFKDNKFIKFVGIPELNILAFISNNNKLNIYDVIENMNNKGWKLNVLQNPPSFHFCITKNHNLEIIKNFCKELNDSIEKSLNSKNKLTGTLAFYGSSQNIENNLFMEYSIHDYVFLQSTKKISTNYD